jgi:hypothetical protein
MAHDTRRWGAVHKRAGARSSHPFDHQHQAGGGLVRGAQVGILPGVQPVLRACYAASGRRKSVSLAADPG